MWSKFLCSNTSAMKLARTIVQGIIGVLVSNLDNLIGLQTWIPAGYKAITAAFIMAILAPLMAELGRHTSDVNEIRIEVDPEEESGAFIPDDTE